MGRVSNDDGAAMKHILFLFSEDYDWILALLLKGVELGSEARWLMTFFSDNDAMIRQSQNNLRANGSAAFSFPVTSLISHSIVHISALYSCTVITNNSVLKHPAARLQTITLHTADGTDLGT